MTQLDGLDLIPLKHRETQNKVTGLPQLAPREVDLRVNTFVALDYMAYQLTRQIEEAIQQSSNRMCQQQQDPLQNGLLAI